MDQAKDKLDIRNIFNKLIVIVSIGILANLAFILWTTDRAILSNVTKIGPVYILMILGLLIVPWLGLSLRLMIWTKFLDSPLKFKDCFRIAFTTDLGSSITPTLIGGGPIKLALLIKHKLPVAKAGTLTLLGAFEDFVMFFCAFFAGCYFLKDTIVAGITNLFEWVCSNGLLLLSVVLLMIISIWLVKNNLRKWVRQFLPQRIYKKLSSVYHAIGKGIAEMRQTFKLIIQKGKLRFLLSFCLLICQWLAKLSILIVILSALGLDFDAFQMYIQQWLVYLSMLFVPTPGATGGAEASFYFIFNGEISDEYLPLIVSVWRFFTYYMVLFLAIALVQIFSLLEKK